MSPLLSLALVATLAADNPPPPKRVEHALTYLCVAQRDDGHWPTKNANYESAVTSLAGLASPSAGITETLIGRKATKIRESLQEIGGKVAERSVLCYLYDGDSEPVELGLCAESMDSGDRLLTHFHTKGDPQ